MPKVTRHTGGGGSRTRRRNPSPGLGSRAGVSGRTQPVPALTPCSGRRHHDRPSWNREQGEKSPRGRREAWGSGMTRARMARSSWGAGVGNPGRCSHRCVAQRGEATCPKTHSWAAWSPGARPRGPRALVATPRPQRPAMGVTEPIHPRPPGQSHLADGGPSSCGHLGSNRKSIPGGVPEVTPQAPGSISLREPTADVGRQLLHQRASILRNKHFSSFSLRG